MGSITVNNLGKAYKQYPTRWSRLIEWLLPDENKPLHTLKWVLQDVSFTINPGEAVGIVGVNGAGKSTLLKMITGTTQPTTGSVRITGRVAALLELGMGFHPDFTGRQNAVMAGQLQGLSVEEIQALMPEIEAFADIGDYINQPVRVYSSGMVVRLAFAVATAKRPDILIVDEALSVGDRFFSHKSFARIQSFLDSGTTLLFVSHDATAVKTLCDRAILLDGGRISMHADPESVLDRYNGLILENVNNLANAKSQTEDVSNFLESDKTDLKLMARDVDGFTATHYQIDTGEVRFSGIKILNSKGKKTIAIITGSEINISYLVTAIVNTEELHFGIGIRDRLAVSVFNTTTAALGIQSVSLRQGQSIEVNFKIKVPLQVGYYGICFGVVSSYLGNGEFEKYMLHVINAEILEVSGTGASSRFGGVVDLSPKCSLKVSL